MEIKVKIAIMVVAFCFCVPAFSSSAGEISHLDQSQGNMKYKTVCGTGIAHPNKFGHGSGGRGGSHAAAAGGGHPNDGGSQSSYMQGGSATIPLYAAGVAAGDHRNYHRGHNGSNRHYNGVEIVSLAFTVLACLLLREEM